MRRPAVNATLKQMEQHPVVILEGPQSSGRGSILQQVASEVGAELLDLNDRSAVPLYETRLQEMLAGGGPVAINLRQGGESLLEQLGPAVKKGDSQGPIVITGLAPLPALRNSLDLIADHIGRVTVWPLSQLEIHGGGDTFIQKAFEDPHFVLNKVKTWTPAEYPRERWPRWRGYRGEFPSPYQEKVLTGGYHYAIRSESGRSEMFEEYLYHAFEGDVIGRNMRSPQKALSLLHWYATCSGEALNMTRAARGVGLAPKTAENYTQVLERMFMVYRHPLWTPEGGTSGRPLMHITDTGLGGYLTGAAVEGNYYRSQKESTLPRLLTAFAVGEVLKQLSWADEPFKAGFYRTDRREDVDLVVERLSDGKVIAIQVDPSSQLSEDSWRPLVQMRDDLGKRFHMGILLHTHDWPARLADRLCAAPLSQLWAGASSPDVQVVLAKPSGRKPVPSIAFWEESSPQPSAKTFNEGLEYPMVAPDDSDVGEVKEPLPARWMEDRRPLEMRVADAVKKVEGQLAPDGGCWEMHIAPFKPNMGLLSGEDALSPVITADFYSSEGLVGRFKKHGPRLAGDNPKMMSVGQSVCLVGDSRAVLVHPPGTMVAVGKLDALSSPDDASVLDIDKVREWAEAFVGAARDLLIDALPDSPWAYWTVGRKLTHPDCPSRLMGNAAVVESPPYVGFRSAGNPLLEIQSLVATFCEWFGLPQSQVIPEAFPAAA